MSDRSPTLAVQFADAEQQAEASHLGMWTFLATEVLFFGGLFMAYILYRHTYFEGFAEGSRHTDLLYGTLNTGILLTSSLSMALAVHAAETNRTRACVRFLVLTILFALGFLVVKGFEYHEDFIERLVPGPGFDPSLPAGAQMFFWLYWTMTGLHAIHVTVGIGLLAVIMCLARRGRYSSAYYTPVEVSGLYWHFVDLVWIFLYPLLYLIDRHG